MSRCETCFERNCASCSLGTAAAERSGGDSVHDAWLAHPNRVANGLPQEESGEGSDETEGFPPEYICQPCGLPLTSTEQKNRLMTRRQIKRARQRAANAKFDAIVAARAASGVRKRLGLAARCVGGRRCTCRTRRRFERAKQWSYAATIQWMRRVKRYPPRDTRRPCAHRGSKEICITCAMQAVDDEHSCKQLDRAYRRVEQPWRCTCPICTMPEGPWRDVIIFLQRRIGSATTKAIADRQQQARRCTTCILARQEHRTSSHPVEVKWKCTGHQKEYTTAELVEIAIQRERNRHNDCNAHNVDQPIKSVASAVLHNVYSSIAAAAEHDNSLAPTNGDSQPAVSMGNAATDADAVREGGITCKYTGATICVGAIQVQDAVCTGGLVDAVALAGHNSGEYARGVIVSPQLFEELGTDAHRTVTQGAAMQSELALDPSVNQGVPYHGSLRNHILRNEVHLGNEHPVITTPEESTDVDACSQYSEEDAWIATVYVAGMPVRVTTDTLDSAELLMQKVKRCLGIRRREEGAQFEREANEHHWAQSVLWRTYRVGNVIREEPIPAHEPVYATVKDGASLALHETSNRGIPNGWATRANPGEGDCLPRALSHAVEGLGAEDVKEAMVIQMLQGFRYYMKRWDSTMATSEAAISQTAREPLAGTRTKAFFDYLETVRPRGA